MTIILRFADEAFADERADAAVGSADTDIGDGDCGRRRAVHVGAGGAQGPPPLPPLHQVKYTVFAEQPFFVDIYYRDVDPENWAAYSHNPYVYSPKVEAQVGPDQQWNLDVQLAKPDQWAMVTATSGPGKQNPNIHCVLAVDGVVVATHQGPKGALCSIRKW